MVSGPEPARDYAPETRGGGLARLRGAVLAAWVASLVLGLICLAFFLTHLAPGDPARIVLGPNAHESAVAALRREMGLERPLAVQFADYFGRMVTGRWGESWLSRRSVARELGQHLSPTLWIGFFAVILSGAGAVAINTLVFAWPRLRFVIPAFRVGVALPGVVVAMFCAVAATRFAPALGGGAGYLVPGMAAGLYSACLMASLLHDRFAQIQQSSAFRAARTLGYGKADLLTRLLLPNSRSLLATLVVNQIGLIFFSTIIAEMIFSIRGLGHLLVRSIMGKDLPVIAALLFCNGLFFLALQAARSVLLPAPGESPHSRFREVVL
jgi:ABC-type dipeptide/oligopeptide/nickel transport system permease component